MITASCPECHQSIDIASDLEIGQQVMCQSCHMCFEVTWLFPLHLDYLEISEQIDTTTEYDDRQDDDRQI